MAHMIGELDFAIYAEKPWHGIGDILNRPITVAEAKAKIGVQIAAKPLVLAGMTEPVAGYRVNYRTDLSDSDPRGVVGIVGEDYTIIQNETVVDLTDAFARALGGHLESAFTMFNGRRVVVAAKCGEEQTIRNGAGAEPFQPYVWSYSSHDGLVKATLRMAAILPVCNNTVLAALRGQSHTIKITHTQSSVAAIKRVVEAANGNAAYYGDMLAALSFLAGTPATGEAREQFLDELFPAPVAPAKGASEEVAKGYARAKKANDAARDKVLVGFESSVGGMDLPTRRGTLYGLVQSAAGAAEHTPRIRVSGGADNATEQEVNEAKLRGLFEGATGVKIETIYSAGLKVAAAVC